MHSKQHIPIEEHNQLSIKYNNLLQKYKKLNNRFDNILKVSDKQFNLKIQELDTNYKHNKRMNTIIKQSDKEARKILDERYALEDESIKSKALQALDKQLFNLVFEKATNGVLILDTITNTFIECNNQIVDILKSNSKDDILNTDLAYLSPAFQPDGRRSDEKSNEMINIAIHTGINSFEWKYLRSDGKEFWAKITLTKYSTENKTMILVVLEDIDNKKQLEKQSKLFENQSKKASLGRLISMIAHQWRQPLSLINAITSSLYRCTINNSCSPQKIQNDLAEIEEVTCNLSTTISNIHNFYAQDKKSKIKSINNIIYECIDILFPPISSSMKPKFIINEIDKLTLNGYIVGLEQSIITILSNAVDIFEQRYIEHPQIQIDLYKENGFNYISIEDNGGGIDEEKIDKIFEVYYSTNNQAQSVTRGFGLYIAKDIIQNNLNGTINVINSKYGAKFIIRYK